MDYIQPKPETEIDEEYRLGFSDGYKLAKKHQQEIYRLEDINSVLSEEIIQLGESNPARQGYLSRNYNNNQNQIQWLIDYNPEIPQ